MGDIEITLFRIAFDLGLVNRGEASRAQETVDGRLRRTELGAFFSSRISGERPGRPVTVSARRRGVTNALAPS